MKRIVSLLLCALLMLTSAVVFAVPASAAEKVVFVDTDKDGDGSSPEKALASIFDAFAALGEEGGTMVISGNVTELSQIVDLPAWKGTIKITSVYNGVDYRKTNEASLDLHESRFFLYGPTVFDDLNMNIFFSTGILICANWNPIEFGEGFESTILGTKGIYLMGGTQSASEGEYAFRDKDTHMIIRSGQFYLVTGSSRGISDTFTGNCVIDIYGDTIITDFLLAAGCNGSGTFNGATFNIHGGEIALLCYGGANNPCQTTGTVTTNFYGGKILGVDMTNANGTNVFNYAENADADSIQLAKDAGIATIAPLSAAPTTTEAPVVTTAAPVVTTAAPVVTDAPVVTTAAPVVTTAAPTQAEPTPSTGDASVMVVFAAAAVICVAAVVVIKKREN